MSIKFLVLIFTVSIMEAYSCNVLTPYDINEELPSGFEKNMPASVIKSSDYAKDKMYDDSAKTLETNFTIDFCSHLFTSSYKADSLLSKRIENFCENFIKNTDWNEFKIADGFTEGDFVKYAFLGSVYFHLQHNSLNKVTLKRKELAKPKKVKTSSKRNSNITKKNKPALKTF